MAITLEGEYTTARILVDEESLVEENCLEQIRELVDHPAFTEPVRVMPDAHWGAGAPVGFTMTLPDKVVPNIVGVDVGCGMTATDLGPELPLEDAERERRVREAVPMGRNVHDYDEAPHLVDEFPFDRANEVFDRFAAAYEDRFDRPIDPLEFEFDGYDGDYFKGLCRRVLSRQRQGMGHVIRSAGTLGGGNHFIEFAAARESGDYWLVVHSGSRYLGKSVAEYWQHRANQYRNADAIREIIPDEYAEYLKFDPETVSDRDLYEWVTGGKGESHIRKERVREDFEGTDVEAVFDRLSRPHEDVDERNEELDWLEGREAHGYYVDMLFAQQYARWNRRLMSDAICDVLDVEETDRVESIHNYIDFRDLTIRKGATPAREGQRLIIPFNMAEGSILARGKGNEEWNRTAPHGAGRVMGRREAHEELNIEAFEDAMEGVYSESVVEEVVDEAPMAYKPTEAIAEAIEPTAEIVDWLEVVHNLKAKE
ncbi:tRNA-splicing ligase RtcB [Halalkaliarchaeum desulfuricum]|uniref:tRNA-splicing ligase RtcB n=1 Tax=Halalkaliarchaeum desulfuricum TaxID=2055893 RepID=A0A343TJT8_9EURY|nr:RtcB family protein [Halalkaliarchaeum desulfuricum]AUX09360.1 tRNA-splicing ligase RtcB [Halalkaliarchaeum desulfuricum]